MSASKQVCVGPPRPPHRGTSVCVCGSHEVSSSTHHFRCAAPQTLGPKKKESHYSECEREVDKTTFGHVVLQGFLRLEMTKKKTGATFPPINNLVTKYNLKSIVSILFCFLRYAKLHIYIQYVPFNLKSHLREFF